MELFSYPLVTALVGNLSAQFAKGVVQAISHRSISPAIIFASGGMPSSHSATVSALAVAVGLVEGFGSSEFAIAMVFLSVVAYDAMGVRLAAGRHAAALNILIDEFSKLRELAMSNEPHKGRLVVRRFRERIGHSVEEVFTGLAFGAVVALLMFQYWPGNAIE